MATATPAIAAVAHEGTRVVVVALFDVVVAASAALCQASAGLHFGQGMVARGNTFLWNLDTCMLL